MSDQRDDVWAAMTAIYDGFMAGDHGAIDRHIAPDATMWDAFHEPLVRGHDELNALRDARPSDGPKPTALVPSDVVVDVFGDTAVLRHVLTVRFDGAPEERVRVTGVWRRSDGRWLCVHNHEDLLT